MHTIKTVFALVIFSLISSVTHAALIRVSQESASGAGDFDSNILGYVDYWSSPLSTSQFYQYGTPNGSSYNGDQNGGPSSIVNTTINFFVMNNSGLSFINVHDTPNAGNTDSAGMSWSITGDTAAFQTGDENSENSLPIGEEATTFTTNHTWLSCCTDGFALGSLDNDWTLYGEFNSFEGLNQWSVLSHDGSVIDLQLSTDVRVRFDMVAVPEPGSLALIALSLFLFTFRIKGFTL